MQVSACLSLLVQAQIGFMYGIQSQASCKLVHALGLLVQAQIGFMYGIQSQASCKLVHALSLVHNMTLVRASGRERRERRERQFMNYPASVSVGERWLTLE